MTDLHLLPEVAATARVAKLGLTRFTSNGQRIVDPSAGILIKVSLDLNDEAAKVLLSDADLERAIPGSFWEGTSKNGQSCMAVPGLFKRRSLHHTVTDRQTDRERGLTVGRGITVPRHDLGSVIRERPIEGALGFVGEGVALTAVADTMHAAREEVFSPCLSLLTFDSEARVSACVNATPYGLADDFGPATPSACAALSNGCMPPRSGSNAGAKPMRPCQLAPRNNRSKAAKLAVRPCPFIASRTASGLHERT